MTFTPKITLLQLSPSLEESFAEREICWKKTLKET